MFAAMNYAATGTYNIGTGKNYSILEVAEMVAPGHPVEFLPARVGEYQATLADNKKAFDVLGWKPQIDLATGLYITDKYEQMSTPSIIIASR
jgi:UDP-glucose 4-epimerase